MRRRISRQNSARHARHRLGISVLLAVGLLASGFGGSVTTAVASAAATAAPGSLLWQYTTGGSISETPAAANGVVYVISNDGTLYALNAASGAKLWSYIPDPTNPGLGFSSSPTVANGVVYVSAGNDNVYALNAATGAQLWAVATGSPACTAGNCADSTPVVANGVVYVSSLDYSVYALDATTGAKLWSFATGGSTSPVAVANGIVYVTSSDGNLYALNATTGAEVWSDSSLLPSSAVPTVANGVVYVGGQTSSSVDTLDALNAATGAMEWSTHFPNDYIDGWLTAPTVANGVVYLGANDDHIYALDAATGATVWTYATGNSISGTPVVANGVVYAGSMDDTLYALNATTGAKLWSFATAAGIYSSPVVANGVVYAGSMDDTLYALATGGTTPPSYQLALTPASQTELITGDQGLVTATLRDSVTGAPAANVTLSFRVESGPNAGTSGTCFPSSCTTDANGQVDWGYRGTAVGVDTVQVWLDSNGNGTPDTGEPQAAVSVGWVPPAVLSPSHHWAGYVLTNAPVKALSAVITVPAISNCSSPGRASFWIGYNGAIKDTDFLPQVGFEAICSTSGSGGNPCTGLTGPSYYLWSEVNPHIPEQPICSLALSAGDRVNLEIVPFASQVVMWAQVTSPDGSSGLAWSHTFNKKKASYTTMECVGEDPNLSSGQASFAVFSPVEFDNCSAIRDYRAGSILEKLDLYTRGKHAIAEATAGPLTWNGQVISFTVTRA